jgi:hypothetical protein
MSCSTCKKDKSCCPKVITRIGPRGPKGDNGRDGSPIFTVKDNVTTVTNVREIRFTDENAVVTDLGAGVVQVNFTPAETVWNDVLNIPWYSGAGVNSFKPQYTIDRNKITFRGQLYIPLESGGVGIDVTTGNSYLSVASAILREARVSIITNANTNNGTPQGRFMTNSVVAAKNLPNEAIPVARDIIFKDVPAFRRHAFGGHLTLYRSFVTLIICSDTTVLVNSANSGAGCVAILSPFNEEYDGSGSVPLGNDPQALGISRATNAVLPNDYVGATDDAPFTIGSLGGPNPFTVNAHHIQSLGGFILNLEGLSGYLN